MNIDGKIVITSCIAIFVCYLVFKFNILANIITSGVIAFLGYIVLYKCCSILCEKKKIDLDELIKEYGINGVTRIILETFKLFAEYLYRLVINNNIFEFILKRFLFQKDLKKPIMKDDINKDTVLMFEYLVKLLYDKEKHTDTFKHSVEEIWQDKWSFFAHSGYIGRRLLEIGEFCLKEKLQILTVIITYKDGTISRGLFNNDKFKNEMIREKINENSRVDFGNLNNYIKKIVDNKEKYKQSLAKYKKMVNYDK